MKHLGYNLFETEHTNRTIDAVVRPDENHVLLAQVSGDGDVDTVAISVKDLIELAELAKQRCL